MRVGVRGLLQAVEAAEQAEKQIKAKYPAYKGWLVFSALSGEIETRVQIYRLVKAFPAMVVDGRRKSQCINLIAKLEEQEEVLDSSKREMGRQAWKAARAKLDELKEQLSLLAADLEFDSAVHIEIRFNELNYEHVISPLRTDALVDLERTPQTGASIRIVLGTIHDLFCRMTQAATSA